MVFAHFLYFHVYFKDTLVERLLRAKKPRSRPASFSLTPPNTEPRHGGGGRWGWGEQWALSKESTNSSEFGLRCLGPNADLDQAELSGRDWNAMGPREEK